MCFGFQIIRICSARGIAAVRGFARDIGHAAARGAHSDYLKPLGHSVPYPHASVGKIKNASKEEQNVRKFQNL